MQTYPDTHHDTSSNTIFGFWLYLLTDCVMFAAFFAAFAVLRDATYGGPGAAELLDTRQTLIETMILLTSSFACGIAMLFAKSRRKGPLLGWLALAWVLAGLFLGMEIADFLTLVRGGNGWERNAFLSSYFTLVGLHGLHIAVGLLFAAVFAVQLSVVGFADKVLRRLVCLRMYWHFLYFIWIFTFAIVYLMGGK